jgi:hypothetical protein
MNASITRNYTKKLKDTLKLKDNLHFYGKYMNFCFLLLVLAPLTLGTCAFAKAQAKGTSKRHKQKHKCKSKSKKDYKCLFL